MYEKPTKLFNHFLNFYNIPYILRPLYDGFQWRFNWCGGDIIIHEGSYRNKEGYLESYNFPWDMDDVSVMTPYDMAICIHNFYEDLKKIEEDK